MERNDIRDCHSPHFATLNAGYNLPGAPHPDQSNTDHATTVPNSATIHFPSSRLTITAALAMVMASPPLSAGISRPPLTAFTVTVP